MNDSIRRCAQCRKPMSRRRTESHIVFAKRKTCSIECKFRRQEKVHVWRHTMYRWMPHAGGFEK
jgi:hypothetical protein